MAKKKKKKKKKPREQPMLLVWKSYGICLAVVFYFYFTLESNEYVRRIKVARDKNYTTSSECVAIILLPVRR